MTRKTVYRLAVPAALLLLLLAAAVWWLLQPPLEWTPTNSLTPASAPTLADDLAADSLTRGIHESLAYLATLEPATVLRYGPVTVPAPQVMAGLEEFLARYSIAGPTDEFRSWVTHHFDLYESAAAKVLFTGYFEAHVHGSRRPSDRYRFPLYRTPDDLVPIRLAEFPSAGTCPGLPAVLIGRQLPDGTVGPYFTRHEIDFQGVLSGRDFELIWTDNLLDAFFLHIQGSGIVELESGETVRVNYAQRNGHPYYAIGRWLLEREILTPEQVSMQSIRHYLEAHPFQLEEILSTNPSYIFFREVDNGPLGMLDRPLTPYRSIATDRRLFPPGALCYVETELPVFDESGQRVDWQPFRAFVLNQDTGGAIRGAGRVDLFTGFGPASEQVAGHLKRPGRLFFLAPK
ncbi:MAG: MltA domain-containing protein [Acidobacteria bacterium]|nr:MltA domain-containing protein [Acidobacteriota bacterium]